MAEKAWGGVFDEHTDRRVERFTESISFDRRLYAQDIRCSTAHAQMLAKVGHITDAECQQIVQALQQVRREIEQGQFVFRDDLEDIHMHVERALIDRLGDVGRKLHTARSRNDQVSTGFRLWIRDAIDQLDGQIADLQRTLLERADDEGDIILPGYTHLQRAQPVLVAHYLLAYCEKFDRDRARLADCRRRVNQLPLGTCALAGTTLDVDRAEAARLLEFEGIVANSLDASSDRDFAVEFAFVLVLVAEHLSTWAEEWIIWSTAEFDFLKLPQQFCTGSSIMPQKVNPDVLELVRGKTARVIGNLQSLLVLIKGLPLAYNRDLQEDKPPVFDSFDTLAACLEMAAPLVQQTRFNRASIAACLDRGHLDATTLMEHLISLGVPQRTAHHAVGQLVRKALDRGVPLADLPLDDFQAAYGELDESVYDVLGVERAVASFRSEGSTAPDQVKRQLQRWKERLKR